MSKSLGLKRGFPIDIGTVLTIPGDAVIEELASTPSHDGPTLKYCTRLKERSGNRFEYRREGKGKVLMLPQGFRPGVPTTVKVTWCAGNCRSIGAEELVA